MQNQEFIEKIAKDLKLNIVKKDDGVVVLVDDYTLEQHKKEPKYSLTGLYILPNWDEIRICQEIVRDYEGIIQNASNYEELVADKNPTPESEILQWLRDRYVELTSSGERTYTLSTMDGNIGIAQLLSGFINRKIGGVIQ